MLLLHLPPPLQSLRQQAILYIYIYISIRSPNWTRVVVLIIINPGLNQYYCILYTLFSSGMVTCIRYIHSNCLPTSHSVAVSSSDCNRVSAANLPSKLIRIGTSGAPTAWEHAAVLPERRRKAGNADIVLGGGKSSGSIEETAPSEGDGGSHGVAGDSTQIGGNPRPCGERDWKKIGGREQPIKW